MPKEKVLVVDDDSAIRYTLTEALRGGAYDFIGKPIRLGKLQVTIRNGIEG